MSTPQKRGRQPDFRQQGKGPDGGFPPGLWLDDRRMPAWARDSLHLLPGGVAFQAPEVNLPSFVPQGADATPEGRAWVDVFVNYKNFWDNRANVSCCFGGRGGC